MNSNGQLEKDVRLDFESDLKTSMLVGANQHRAHVIAYDTIVRGVMDPINRSIQMGDNKWLDAVYNLILTVFPGGQQSLRHPLLNHLAQKYRTRAEEAFKEITDARNGSATAPPLPVSANKLIGALNNSPDNLRPGAAGTNSSIQQGLDLEPLAPPNDVQTLPAGTPIVDQMSGTNFTTVKLHAPACVLRVKPLDESMVWRLLTTTWSERNELHLYSSGVKLQSSNYTGMSSGTMTNQHPTHVAIKVPNDPAFFLFAL